MVLLNDIDKYDMPRERLPTFPCQTVSVPRTNAICTGHECRLTHRNFTTLKPKSAMRPYVFTAFFPRGVYTGRPSDRSPDKTGIADSNNKCEFM